MNITGHFNDTELIEYIGLKIKFETLSLLVNSEDITDEAKVGFIKAYLKEDK